MSLKTVKGKIKSIDKTRQVTKAMEAVSAVKMRKSQESAFVARPYALNALLILRAISKTFDGTSHPLAETKTGGERTCFIIVTSDRGLAGSLNSAVFKEFERFTAHRKITKEKADMITIGRRGFEHFSKRGYKVIEAYEKWGDSIQFEDVEPLVARVQKLFLGKQYNEIHIVYTNFISTLQQKVYVRKVLPILFEGVEDVVGGIVPETGKYSQRNAVDEENKEQLPASYEFEPDAEEVLAELMPMLLKIQVFHSVLEANASEHSARMMAMKKASDSARDILKDLRLSYNKARQAAITREVSEIIGGSLV